MIHDRILTQFLFIPKYKYLLDIQMNGSREFLNLGLTTKAINIILKTQNLTVFLYLWMFLWSRYISYQYSWDLLVQIFYYYEILYSERWTIVITMKKKQKFSLSSFPWPRWTVLYSQGFILRTRVVIHTVTWCDPKLILGNYWPSVTVYSCLFPGYVFCTTVNYSQSTLGLVKVAWFG